MRILKEIEVKLNLTTKDQYFNLPDSEFVITRIRELFEGKCYESSLVKEVKRIIRQSDTYLSKFTTNGSASINVLFEAEVIVFFPGDIIVGCEIAQFERTGRIICKSSDAVVRLGANKYIQSLGAGAVVPAQVVDASYSIGRDKVTIDAIPYFHSFKFDIFQVSLEPDGKTPKEIFDYRIEEVKTEQDKVAKLSKDAKKHYEFFHDLFYPYKTPFAKSKGASHHAKIKLVNINDLFKLYSGKPSKKETPKKETAKKETDKKKVIYLMRHPIIDKSSPFVYQIDNSFFEGVLPRIKLLEPSDYEMRVVRDTLDHVVYEVLTEQHNHLKMLREHSEVYDKAKVASSKKLWDLYQRRKR